MNCRMKRILIWIGFFFLLCLANKGLSQTEPRKTDSTKIEKSKQDTSRQDIQSQAEKLTEDEIELAEINIEAVIEKPSVSIIPKRIAAELNEMEFIDRSFEKELKKAPDKPLIEDDRLFVPQKIENLKQKLIERKQGDKK